MRFRLPCYPENQGGFLVLEILIAGMILTASIAATMYLFRVGFEHLGRAGTTNTLSSKLPQAVNLLKSIDMSAREGAEDIGDGVTLRWRAELLAKHVPPQPVDEMSTVGVHELFLYHVNFELYFKDQKKEYELNVFRSRPTYSTFESQFF